MSVRQQRTWDTFCRSPNARIFSLAYGKAYVFYPEATKERCTFAFCLEIDPIGLVRNRRGPRGEAGALEQYVNDRPDVASSFLSVALVSSSAGTAMAGRSKGRPELVEEALPLTAKIPVIASRGGEDSFRKLFEPLGYVVRADKHPLDEKFPEWATGPVLRPGTAQELHRPRLADPSLCTHSCA